MRFENSVTIDRKQREVFDFLADFENVPKWNYAIVETKKISQGWVGPGTRYRQTRSIPAPSTEAFEVTEFVPDHRLAIRGDLGPFTGTLTYDLQPVAAATRVTNSVELQSTGLMRVAAPLATGRVRDAVGRNLAELKALLES